MSGVCGIVRFDGRPLSEADIERQMRALAGLGPDRSRHWRAGCAALGALLMRGTHEDAFDTQPLRDEASDLTFVCDVRLDNREELGDALGIAVSTLATMADSAVLFAAFKAWGAGCAERLIGDFVFAVWDGAARTLTLCRDHMGQRHVFFHAGEGFFAFATERKGLWALPDVPRRLPEDQITQMLVDGFVRQRKHTLEESPPSGLGWVPGGMVVVISADGTISERRYWSPHAAVEHMDRDEAYYVAAYRRVLAEAVACRLRRASASVGLLLGGGFDSTAIAALAGPALAPQGRKLIAASCVSASDHERVARDPYRWIELCRRHMPHLEVHYVTQEDPAGVSGLDKSFLLLDAAHSENGFFNDAMFAAVKAAGARTIMDGHGGDYTVNPRSAGYFIDRLKKWRLREFFGAWQGRRRAQGRSHFAMLRAEILPRLLPMLVFPWRRWRQGLAPFGPTMPISRALYKDAIANSLDRPRARRMSIRESMAAILRAQQSSLRVGWSSTAMAHGLAYTQPFHDKRVVELGLAIPEDYLLRNGRERHLARTALRDLYPPEFQTRRDRNDALQPDFMQMAARLRPQLLAEIDRMKQAGRLSTHFDFAKMRRMLIKTNRRGEAYEHATRQAIRAFIWARYMEWFSGANRRERNRTPAPSSASRHPMKDYAATIFVCSSIRNRA